MKVSAPDYADKCDDELLNLALDSGSLTPEARDALNAELKNRNLGSPAQLSNFAHEKRHAELKDDLRRLGLSWRGSGQKLYGNANVEVLGTTEQYDSTLFWVLSYIPLIPVATYRLSRDQGTKNFRVLEKKSLNWGQVVWIWTKTIAIIAALVFGFYALHALGVIK